MAEQHLAEQHLAEQHLAAEERQAEEVLAAVGAVRALDEVQGRIASYFHRREMGERGRRYLEGLLAPGGRKNNWQLAEGPGEAGAPRGPPGLPHPRRGGGGRAGGGRPARAGKPRRSAQR